MISDIEFLKCSLTASKIHLPGKCTFLLLHLIHSVYVSIETWEIKISRDVKHRGSIVAYAFIHVVYAPYQMQVVTVFSTSRPSLMFHSL